MKPDIFDTEPDKLTLALTVHKKKGTLETSSYDYTVDYLFSLIEDGNIIMEQTDSLWKTEKASKLIESLMMNFPISLFYLKEQEDGKWLVIDGKQRLFAIFNFLQNQYKLTGLEIVKEFENKSFKELPPQAKRLINLSVMHIVLIRR
ncbi:protein containing DUF262, partial [Candidatus Thiomargarita nelsonii]